MNITDRELIDGLCQRYVVGTMRGAARVRFEQILKNNKDLADSLLEWEEIMSPLALMLEPIAPSELSLPRIMRSIKRKVVIQQDEVPQQRFAPLAMAAMIMLMGVGWWSAANQEPLVITKNIIKTVVEESKVAVINSEKGDVLWLTKMYPKSGRIDVAVQGKLQPVADKDYELWALTASGKPVSLGLLPKSDKASLALSVAKLEALGSSAKLAVSLEPLGGSPKDVPTGPVLYVASIL